MAETPPPSVETQVANRDPMKSKKWLMSIIGLSCVMVVWITSTIIAVNNSETASHVVSLANIVITFLGSLTGAYTVGQSFVDWRNSTTLSVIDTNEKEERINTEASNTSIREEKTINVHLTEDLKANIVEEGQGAPEIKPFAMAASEEGEVSEEVKRFP